MKYLIFGLGNIGSEYKHTRHNIGFTILDALADASNISFSPARYGDLAEYRFKARTFLLIKPSTYMNLSGKAINYWLQKTGVPLSHMLIILDDLALPFGTIRLRSKGGDGGHNGLKSINQIIGRNDYARLRFGIGNDFHSGQQVDYVLGEWSEQELTLLPGRIEQVHEAIRSFGTIGIQRTMNQFNSNQPD